MPNAIPPATPADGNMRVDVLTAAAGSIPTLTELNADTVANISCYLTPDGFAFTQEQATITDERLCSTETFGLPGRKSSTLSLTGIDNTNSEYETEYNEMADALTEGADRIVVARWGLPYDTPYAAGQKVRVIPIRVGMKAEQSPEANSVIRSTWSTFVSGPSDLVEIPTGG